MRGLRKFLLPVAVVLALAPAAAASAGQVVQTEQVRAELVAEAAEGIEPGKTVWLGLKLEHIPHWHTYWKNAGDSGLPTTLSWTLPDGVTAGDIDWPVPAKLPIGPLLNYGYEGTVLLPVPLTLTQPIAGDTLKVKLRADWLVCEVECIPQSGEFELDVPTR
jgi:thiol:disulfide interchange protein DsbD